MKSYLFHLNFTVLGSGRLDTQVVRKSGRDAIAGSGTLSEPIESLDPYVRVIRAPTSSAVGPG